MPRVGALTMTGELPSGWAHGTINDVAQINPPASTVVVGDQSLVTFLPMAAVAELSGKIDVAAERPFREVKKNFTRFRNNDVLFAKITPSMENGKVAVARGLHGGIGCGTTEFHVIRPATDVAPDYLRLFLVQSRYRHEAKRNMQGAVGQQRVPADFVRESQIPIAPANEQRRIVSKIDELFGRIDEGEQALARVEKLVERYRQSVLKAAVTGELTRDWRAAKKRAGEQVESGAALLARILKARRAAWEAAELKKMQAKSKPPTDDRWKQKYLEPAPPDTADLPELPEGWVWASLPMLCSDDTCNGISVKGSDVPPGTPSLRLDAMTSDGFDYAARRYIRIDASKREKLAIAEGDFFVSRANGSLALVGRAVAAQRPPERVVFPDTMIRYRPLAKVASPLWLATIWSSPLVRRQLQGLAKTTAGIYKVSQEDIAAIAIPVCSLSEQHQLVEAASDAVGQAAGTGTSCSAERHRSSALRQSILKAAFSGQLVPQDPHDEPASKLLERIAAERAATATQRKHHGTPRAV